jgi:hypothetical protein
MTASTYTIGDLALNTAANLPPYVSMITAFCYIMGLAFMISGMMKLKRHAELPQQVPLLAPVIFIAMGVLLVYFPTTITMLRDTFFPANSTETGMSLYQQGTTMDGKTKNSATIT